MSIQPEALDDIPSSTSFTPLTDHQAQTPSTFFGGPPVLHASLKHCHVLISPSTLRRHAAFRVIGEFPSSNGDTVKTNGDPAHDEVEEQDARIEDMLVLEGVEGFVTSESLLLFTPPSPSSPTPRALSIPYPSISLHATQRLSHPPTTTHPRYTSLSTPPAHELQALYLQIDPGNPSTRNPAFDEDDSETVELLLVPQEGNAAVVKEVFEALSRCADLHPDAGAVGDEEGGMGIGEGGLAALLAGGGLGEGWITAENAGEFEGEFEDEEGEAEAESGELGPGAGTRRVRGEEEDETDGFEGGHNGVGEAEEETKWRRTS